MHASNPASIYRHARDLFVRLLRMSVWRLGMTSGVGGALVIYAVLLGATFAATFVGHQPIARRIVESEDILAGARSGGIQYGTNIANDCIFLASLIADDYSDRLAEVIAVRRLGEIQRLDGVELTHCGRTRLAAEQLLNSGRIDLPANYYYQYILGYRPFVAAGLAVMPYRTLSYVLLALSYGAVVIVIGLGLRRMLKPSREGAVVWVVIGLAFALLFGLPSFGGRATHAFWGLGIIAFLVYSCACGTGRQPASYAVATGVFGAIMAQFDFLVGAAPLGLAVAVSVPALRFVSTAGLRLDKVWDETAVGGVAFTTAFVATFVIKLFLVTTLLQGYGFADFVDSLAVRASTSPWREIDPSMLDRIGVDLTTVSTYSPISIGFMFAKLLFSTKNLSFDSYALSLGGLLLSFLVGAIGIRDLWRARGDERNVALLLALTLSVIVILGWFIVFTGHTIVHSRFMDRILVWPAAAGLIVFAYHRRAWLADWARRAMMLSRFEVR